MVPMPPDIVDLSEKSPVSIVVKRHHQRNFPQTQRTGAGYIVATYATLGNEIAGHWG